MEAAVAPEALAVAVRSAYGFILGALRRQRERALLYTRAGSAAATKRHATKEEG